MDYEQKYNKLLNAVKMLKEKDPSDESIQNWVNENIPELAENEDERIRKAIIGYIDHGQHYGVSNKDMIAWLEKQGNDSYLQEKIESFTNAHKGEDPDGIIAACRGGEEQGEKKHSNLESIGEKWSKDNEVKINRIVGFIENLDIPDNDILRKDAAWLKSLKKRLKGE